MSALSAPGRTVDRLTATPRSLAPLLAALASAMFLLPSTALASEPLVFGSPALIDSQAALGVDDPLIGVSCPSSELCLAVDREGYATISTDPTAAAPTWRAPQRIDSAGDLSGVSCPSSALCAAVDMHGNVVISTDPAAADPTWSAPVSIERHSGLSSVSCPSSALCVAVDLDGNAAISADPAAATPTWGVSQIDRQESRDGHGNSLHSVSCPSVELCVAVGRGGSASISLDPSAPSPVWSPPADIDGIGDLTSVSCPSSGLCVAVDAGGRTVITSDPGAAKPSWSSPASVDQGAVLSSVSCPSSAFCTAVGLDGDVVVSTDPSAATPGWSAPLAVDHGEGLSGVSCPASALCVAVDLTGSAVIGTTRSSGPESENMPSPTTTTTTSSAPATTAASVITVATPIGLSSYGLPAAPVFAESEIVRVLSGTVTVRLNGSALFVPISQAGAGTGGGATGGGSGGGTGTGSGGGTGTGSGGGTGGGTGSAGGGPTSTGPEAGVGVAAVTLPNGSEVDATNGHVLITVATRTPGRTVSAGVRGGRFRIVQERGGSGETHFVLTLPLTGCPRVSLPRGAAAVASRHHRRKRRSGPKSRHLWVYEKGGNWGTNGRYVSTSVEGTHWLTQDECVHSRVRVVSGRVSVRDLVRRRSRTLTAGQSYVAVRR